MAGREEQTTGLSLAGGHAGGRHFHAVVDAVAHQVRQRIDDALNQALVQFRGGAIGDEIDLLAQLGRQVAYHAREARKDEIHRHHADRHHRFLQVARIARQVADAVEQFLVQHRVERTGALLDHRLRDHQLAHQVDQLVDFFNRDADRRRFGTGLLALFFGRFLFRLHLGRGARHGRPAGVARLGGIGADLGQRLEETIALFGVALYTGGGADVLERLEETIAGVHRALSGRRPWQGVEETIALGFFLRRASRFGFAWRQWRRLRDHHVVGIEHERADG